MSNLSKKGSKLLGEDNSFINLRDGASGHVILKLHENSLSASGQRENCYYGRVPRFTFSNQNVLDRMAQELPDMKTGRITDVMTAYTKVLLDVLASGYAVRFGALGTFYIAPVGFANNPGDKLPLTVRFSPDVSLLSAVSKVEIADTSLAQPVVEFGQITDASRAACDGAITAGASVLVEGDGLRIGGEESGLWLAPVMEDGSYSQDEIRWKKISVFLYNHPKKLMFTLPSDIGEGRYVFVLRTKCSGGTKRLRKKMLEGVSESFIVRSAD
ncbi:MAG: DUF4469 domain-containing protein [Treponema sp.]|nr:DUF4469 domain-containing protein [Treponema sp.]